MCTAVFNPGINRILPFLVFLIPLFGCYGGSDPEFEFCDFDNDGILDHNDWDIDGDGFANHVDAFPYDPFEFYDHDLNGIGNGTQLDEDGDGISDFEDDFPLNANYATAPTFVETEFNGNIQDANLVHSTLDGATQVPPDYPYEYRSVRIQGSLADPYDTDFYKLVFPQGGPVTVVLRATNPLFPFPDELSMGLSLADGTTVSTVALQGKDKGYLRGLHGTFEDHIFAVSVSDLSGRASPDLTYEMWAFVDDDLDLCSDDLEYAVGSSILSDDTDHDALNDADELAMAMCNSDPDGDSIHAWLDVDSDDDGYLDGFEEAFDADGDGLASFIDQDSDGNGVNDALEPLNKDGSPCDLDGDSVFDFLDLDDDGDGLIDTEDFATSLIPNWSPGFGQDFIIWSVSGTYNGHTLPNRLYPDGTVTITGGPFTTSESYRVMVSMEPNKFGLNKVSLDPIFIDDQTLEAKLPSWVTAGDVYVFNLTQQYRTVGYPVSIQGHSDPMLEVLSDNTIASGSTIYLYGDNFLKSGAGKPLVFLNGESLDVTNVGQDYIEATLSGDSTSGYIHVNAGGQESNPEYITVYREVSGQISGNINLGVSMGELSVVTGFYTDENPVYSNGSFFVKALANKFSIASAVENATAQPRLLGIIGPDDQTLELDEHSTALALCYLSATLFWGDFNHDELVTAIKGSPLLPQLGTDLKPYLEGNPETLEKVPADICQKIVALLKDMLGKSKSSRNGNGFLSGNNGPEVKITPPDGKDDFYIIQDDNNPYNLIAENDSMLYASAMVVATETKAILRPHIQNGLYSNFINPQGGLLGWPPIYNSTKTPLHAPFGKDCMIEIITGGRASGDGYPSSYAVSNWCSRATAMYQLAIPTIQTLIEVVIGASPPAAQWIGLLNAIDPAAYIQAMNEFSQGDILDGCEILFNMVINDLGKGPSSRIITFFATYYQKHISTFIANVLIKKFGMALSILSYGSDFAKVLYDVENTGARLNFEAEFELELDSVTPVRMVNYHWGNKEEDVKLVAKGSGFHAYNPSYGKNAFGIEIGDDLFLGGSATQNGTCLELTLGAKDVVLLNPGKQPVNVVLNANQPEEVRSNKLEVEVLDGPWIDALVPESGAAGDVIKIEGLGFYPNNPADANTVVFTGKDNQLFPVGAKSVSKDGKSLWVKVPDEVETGPVYVYCPLPTGFTLESNSVQFTTDFDITITYVDNGSAKDDIFALYFDDKFIHTTNGPSWPAQTVMINTSPGWHDVDLVGIAAPDNIGTYGISFSSNIYVDPNTSDPLTGSDLVANAVKHFDIEVDTSGRITFGNRGKSPKWITRSPFEEERTPDKK